MNKQEFFQSINSDTEVNDDFCKMLYAYSCYDKQFLIDVMNRFADCGRKNVIYVYTIYVYMEQDREYRMLVPAARWLKEQIDKDYERKEKEWQKMQFSSNSPQNNCLMQQKAKLKELRNRLV